MKELESKEMKAIKGGGLSIGGIAAITMGIVFIIGVIDGYVRPLKCN